MLVSLASAADLKHPPRYLPNALDSGLVQVANPQDGRTWAAWAYRNGAEYDIALSSATPDGEWTEPVLFGLDDGKNQVQPAMAIDGFGNLYLAFIEGGSGRVLLTQRIAGLEVWSDPVSLGALGGRGVAPALKVVGDRLVVAIAVKGGIEILDLPLSFPAIHGNGLQDDPDPGATDDGKDDNDNSVDDSDERDMGSMRRNNRTSGQN